MTDLAFVRKDLGLDKQDKLEEKEHDRLSKLDQISLGRLANL